MLHEVQVEARFSDGSKLVTIHHPIALEHGDLTLALCGSFCRASRAKRLARRRRSVSPVRAEVIAGAGDLEINAGREAIVIPVTNHGDRPIQVGRSLPLRGDESRARLRSRSRMRTRRHSRQCRRAIRTRRDAKRRPRGDCRSEVVRRQCARKRDGHAGATREVHGSPPPRGSATKEEAR
jgi:urease subunit gamma/beta